MFDSCDSCHGQANKLLDSAKEMEDSIGVNLRYVYLNTQNVNCDMVQGFLLSVMSFYCSELLVVMQFSTTRSE